MTARRALLRVVEHRRPMPGPKRAAVILAAALAACAAGPARAAEQGPEAPGAEPLPAAGRSEARARFEAAEQAARELRFADALRGYQEALAADPSAPFAGAARTRAAHLAARAEGDFAPLVMLERMRRDPARLADRDALGAFEREVAALQPGRVRSEARALIADAYLGRLGDRERAAAALAALVDDPAADRLSRSLALGQLVALLRERGDLGAARAAVDRHRFLAPALRREVLRVTRRVDLRWVSIAVLGGIALAGAASLARAAASHRADLGRRLFPPIAVAFALYLGGAAAVLTRIHGGADPRPFLWLGLGVLGVDVAARALRLAAPDLRPAARAAWALCCVAGVLAAAFLSLERTNAGYLESFGL